MSSMTLTAPAVASSKAPMGALLAGREVILTSAHKGAAVAASLARTLHLGVAFTWATRMLQGVIGLLGLRTLVVAILTSALGQRIVKWVARTAMKVIGWPLKKMFRLGVWLLSKIGAEKVLTYPAAVIGAASYGYLVPAAKKVTGWFSPSRTWVRVLNAAARFRLSWLAAGASFVPGPIGVVLKGLLLASVAYTAYGYYTNRKARAEIMGRQAVEIATEVFKSERRMSAAEHAQVVVDTTLADIITERIAAEKEADATLDAPASSKVDEWYLNNQAIESDASKVVDLEMALEVHEAEAIAAAEVDEPALTVNASKDLTNEEAHLLLQEIGTEAYARLCADREIPAFVDVMGRNEAKRILTDLTKAAKVA
jgi:hypothetical protein